MTPLPKTTSSVADFPSVDYEAWRQRVREELAGQEPESSLGTELPGGLAVRPLYSAETSSVAERVLPECTSQVSDASVRRWRIAVEINTTDPRRAAQIIKRDVARGADLLWLGPACFEHLGSVVQGVDLESVALVLAAGANSAVAEARWRVLHRGVDPHKLSGCLGGDPLATLALQGGLNRPLEAVWKELTTAALHCVAEAPGMRAALVSSVPYHEAGATVVDELACSLAAGIETLRQFTAAGLDIDRAAGQLLFSFAVGSDLFLEIAKLRAARLLWAKVVAASGGGEEARRMRIHVRTSATTWARRAPWLNLLRGGIEGFAAAVAGVWSIGVQPFDSVLGLATDTSRRLAISTQHLLAEEAHLGKVADPAAGSWYVEDLTGQLARGAWRRCREIEGLGGLTEALLRGRVQSWVAHSVGQRLRAVAHRREVLVGVNDFAHLEEKTPVREAVPAADRGGAGVTVVGPATVRLPAPLRPQRLGLGFEALRQAAEEWQQREGRRPTLGLLGLGPLKEHAARCNFARAFFAPGGIETVPLPSAEAFDGTILDGVVVCGGAPRYVAEVPSLLPTLRARRARWVFLAGKPPLEDEASFRQAGVDAFVFSGADVLEVLATFLGDLGVHT